MNSLDNMLLNDPILNSDIKNKGFVILDEMFKTHGWHMINNEYNWIYYTNVDDESSYVDIKIATDKIIVSVPIKNSIYQYVTTFNGYYEASEYVERKFLDYIK